VTISVVGVIKIHLRNILVLPSFNNPVESLQERNIFQIAYHCNFMLTLPGCICFSSLDRQAPREGKGSDIPQYLWIARTG